MLSSITKKGEIERVSRHLVCFGALIDNTIKGLTCLHEIMNMYLIMKCVLKEMVHVLQASVFIPLVKCVCVKQNKKRKIEQGIHG